jgi:uncharacterized protein YcbK (DUF882 family)
MRFAVLPFALALALPVSAFAGTDTVDFLGDDGDSAAAAAPSAAPEAAAKPRKRSRHGSKMPHARGPKPVGWAVPESKLRAEPLPRPSGNLALHVLATHEQVKLNIYNEDGSYDVDAIKQVSHLLRCKRTDTEKDIEPRLMTILSHVYDHYGKPIEIVSGFRNQQRTTSFHYRGSASDIRIPGVEPKKLRNFVDSLDAGGMGVGLYPRSKFVHVDVRPLPSYRWIDYSKSDPDSPDKRPPRGFKKKRKLQS